MIEMRYRKFSQAACSALVLAFVAWSTLAIADDVFVDLTFGVAITSDVVYATGSVQSPTPGMKDLLLDLYEPSGVDVPALKPGFVFIHGGGFINGDKTNPALVALCNEYAQRGYVAVSINYRLTGDDAPTPGETLVARAINAAIEDAANAVRWMRDNAISLGIDSDRIAIGGASAGAVTSLFVAYSDLGTDAEVRAVLSMAGGLYGQESLIEADEPPLIMIHGTADTTVPFSLALDIEAAANSVNLPLEFYALTGIGHIFVTQLDVLMVDGVTLSVKIRDFMYRRLELAALGAPDDLVHVDFENVQLETGSSTRPWNTVGEALELVMGGGVIRINGDSQLVSSAETFSGGNSLNQAVTIEVVPAGANPVRIGAAPAREAHRESGFVSGK